MTRPCSVVGIFSAFLDTYLGGYVNVECFMLTLALVYACA